MSQQQSNEIVNKASNTSLSKQIRAEMLSYSGPLPSAEQLEKYEKLYAGAAKLFFEKFAEEQAHRQELEKSESEIDKNSINRHYEIISEGNRLDYQIKFRSDKFNFIGNLTGQIFSILICLSALALCGFLAVNNHSWEAVSVVAIPLAGIIKAIMGNKK